MRWSCLSRLSLRLPKTPVSKRLSMGVPVGSWVLCGDGYGPGRWLRVPQTKKERQAPFLATRYCTWRRRQGVSSLICPVGAPDLHALGGALLAEELARVEHAAVLPDFEMHVGAGGAAGRAGLGDLLAAAHQVADLPAKPRVVDRK